MLHIKPRVFVGDISVVAPQGGKKKRNRKYTTDRERTKIKTPKREREREGGVAFLVLQQRRTRVKPKEKKIALLHSCLFYRKKMSISILPEFISRFV